MRQGTGYIFGLIGFCILTFGLCVNQVAFAKHAQEVPEATLSHDEAVDQLENFLEMVGELRSHVDRSQFDLDALLDKLDYDVDNIVQFVRQEIQFEQYPGLLRGAKGTLLSRAGNALDQAVLAASLLGSAGYDVRIARGKLDEVTAKVLVQQIAANVRVDLPAGDQAEFGQITDAILRLLPQSASEGHEQSTLVPVESTEPYLAAGGTARRLLGVLHEHGITSKWTGCLPRSGGRQRTISGLSTAPLLRGFGRLLTRHSLHPTLSRRTSRLCVSVPPNTHFRRPGADRMMLPSPMRWGRHHGMAAAQSERVAAAGGGLAA
jgi:hypothetical protein